MNKNKLVGPGIAIAAAFIFLGIVALNFPALTEGMFGKIEKPAEKLTLAQIVVSFFGFIGAISAFSFAIYQYIQSARWKRMEFIANEVKEFEADPVVQNALLMIDWGTRKINFSLGSDPKQTTLITITRDDQWKALLPHKLKVREKYPEYQSKKFIDSEPKPDKKEPTNNNEEKPTFTMVEAKIRDTYDVFFTRLDRFSTFIDAKLIDANELKPFINYWIDSITKNTEPEKDAKWRCALLTYIIFYNYTGVESLLKKYDCDIHPDKEIFQNVKNSIEDKELAERLYQYSIKRWTDN